MDAEDHLLQKCKLLIEKKLGWNDSESWTNHDFQTISDKIQEETGVSLSIATLKRIWGKVKYDSKPTITTLNTLSRFLGFENWRAFRQSFSAGEEKVQTPVKASQSEPTNLETSAALRDKKRIAMRVGLIGTAALSVIVLLVIYGFKKNPVGEVKAYSFSSKKVVSEGVPNSVIFDYDATAATTDSIFIQQSWDARLRTKVSRDMHQHTSIYYTPGFFQAKLVVDNQVVREHNLTITSDGWLALVKQSGPVPVYFKDEEFKDKGALSLSVDDLEKHSIPFQPELPVVSFYNVRDFGNIFTNDFMFEARVRNSYTEGSGACQFSQILLLTEGNVVIIPLSIKGCVSDLGLFVDGKGIDGKTSDLSAFGTDMSKWVDVKCEVKDSIGKILINGNVAYETAWASKEKIVGMIVRFQGAGSIDHIKLASTNNEFLYEDSF